MTTREQVEWMLILLAHYEARARRLARRLPGDPELDALLADIARHRDSAIEALSTFITDVSGGVH